MKSYGNNEIVQRENKMWSNPTISLTKSLVSSNDVDGSIELKLQNIQDDLHNNYVSKEYLGEQNYVDNEYLNNNNYLYAGDNGENGNAEQYIKDKGFIKSDALNDYAKTEDLNEFYKEEDVTNYLKYYDYYDIYKTRDTLRDEYSFITQAYLASHRYLYTFDPDAEGDKRNGNAETYLIGRGFIKSDALDDYAKTEDLNEFYKEEDVKNYLDENNYLNQETADAKYATSETLENYATKDDINGFFTETDMKQYLYDNEYLDKTTGDKRYLTKTEASTTYPIFERIYTSNPPELNSTNHMSFYTSRDISEVENFDNEVNWLERKSIFRDDNTYSSDYSYYDYINQNCHYLDVYKDQHYDKINKFYYMLLYYDMLDTNQTEKESQINSNIKAHPQRYKEEYNIVFKVRCIIDEDAGLQAMGHHINGHDEYNTPIGYTIMKDMKFSLYKIARGYDLKPYFVKLGDVENINMYKLSDAENINYFYNADNPWNYATDYTQTSAEYTYSGTFTVDGSTAYNGNIPTTLIYLGVSFKANGTETPTKDNMKKYNQDYINYWDGFMYFPYQDIVFHRKVYLNADALPEEEELIKPIIPSIINPISPILRTTKSNFDLMTRSNEILTKANNTFLTKDYKDEFEMKFIKQTSDIEDINKNITTLTDKLDSIKTVDTLASFENFVLVKPSITKVYPTDFNNNECNYGFINNNNNVLIIPKKHVVQVIIYLEYTLSSNSVSTVPNCGFLPLIYKSNSTSSATQISLYPTITPIEINDANTIIKYRAEYKYLYNSSDTENLTNYFKLVFKKLCNESITYNITLTNLTGEVLKLIRNPLTDE